MIPKSGNRFSEKIMLKQGAAWTNIQGKSNTKASSPQSHSAR
jgi:hypothetical protein